MTEQGMKRRRFFKIAGGAALGGLVACGGIGVVASRKPEIEMPTASHPGAGKRILVAYASATGSTAESAAAMGEVLAKMGYAVDVRSAGEVQGVGEYDGVILGSAIRVGKPLAAAGKLVESHGKRLRERPTACFVLCMTAAEETPEARSEADLYPTPLAEAMGARHVGVFPGAILPERLSAIERTITKMVGSKVGDHRDWEAMRAWAREYGEIVHES